MECPHGFRKCFLPEVNESVELCVSSKIDYFANFNFSLTEVSRIIHEHIVHDQNIDRSLEISLIFTYALLIISGLLANLIVSFVVARKTQMHTPRNLYIVNLTASDMSLCVICMPFTLVSIIQRHWDLGLVMCKLIPALQGANILVSVGTITVIALDRYVTIVRGQEGLNTKRRVIISVSTLWVLSALTTTPIFYYQVLMPVRLNGLVLYEICVEGWPSQTVKMMYTSSVLLVQAVIPAVVVGAVHTRIATYLHKHARSLHDQRRVHREIERNRRTTLLLSIMTVLFALSWLPLSLFSLTTDFLYPTDLLYPDDLLHPADSSLLDQDSLQRLYLGFAVCHVVAMSSAVSNPIVYGWFNSNIRKEFLQLLQSKCGSAGVGDVPAPQPPSVHPPPVVTKPAFSVTTQTVCETVSSRTLMESRITVYHSGVRPLRRECDFTIETIV